MLIKLLAEKYDGILCEENYQNRILDTLDKNEFPALTYTRDLKEWSKFVRRSPDEYELWIKEVTKECTILEIKLLTELSKQNKPIFVDTNIPPEILHDISDNDHVVIMLTDPDESVNRFFDRHDREKQFIYQLLLKEKNPTLAINNFRECLKRINSKANYNYFLNSGFNVIIKDNKRSIDETLKLIEEKFKLIN